MLYKNLNLDEIGNLSIATLCIACYVLSNEITIPILLEQLDLEGGIVTTDAMGIQTSIAKQIQDAGAEYILALKANHPTLASSARNWFEKYQNGFEKTEFHASESICEAGHHRIEKRRFFSVPVEQVFEPARIKQWAGLQTLIVQQSSRQLWNKTTQSLRFFLSSLNPDFSNFPHAIRSHWEVENQLHWCLDVIFALGRFSYSPGSCSSKYESSQKTCAQSTSTRHF